MRARLLFAAVPLTLFAACSGSDADPAADLIPTDTDLLLVAPPTAAPLASDVEVHRPPAGVDEPRPAPQPPTAPAAARASRQPAVAAPDEDRGGHAHHGVAGEPAPETVIATAPEAGAAEGVAAGSAPAVATGTGTGKPRPVLNEGPVPDPGGRGPTIIIRGGVGTIDDDCAIHPRGMPGVIATPDMVVNTGPADVGALINDRTPPGGTIAANRPPPGSDNGDLHPGGGRLRAPLGGSMTGGRSAGLPTTGGARNGGILPRGGIR